MAEHSFYVAIIGWVLAKLERADENKVIKMGLIHDLPEVRGGDKNLVNKFYNQMTNEPKITEEISQDYDMKDFPLNELFQEFFEGRTLEAKVAKDADILSGLFLEKESLDLGSRKAAKWVYVSLKRLKTKKGKELGQELVRVNADSWWLKLVERYILTTEFL